MPVTLTLDLDVVVVVERRCAGSLHRSGDHHAAVLANTTQEVDDLAVARVAARIDEGGHPVPEEKIRQRFERNAPLIREAALLADRAMVFDASALNERPVVLLELAQGQLARRAGTAPEWFEGLYPGLE